MTTPEITKLSDADIWQRWIEKREQPVKDELVLRYLKVVEQVAGRMKIGLPDSMTMDELVNSGIIGLIGAIDHFEPERGFKFETYAVNRIRGSILDCLRDYDWMPRSIRSKTRSLETALVKLEGQLGRVPLDEEIADELELDLDGYYALLDEVKVASILSLDQPIPGDEGEMSTLGDLLEDEDAEDADTTILWNEARDLAKRLIKGLSQQERLVIALYYYEELTLREVGEVLGISESRVSQVHSKVILTIKGKLRMILEDRRRTPPADGST